MDFRETINLEIVDDYDNIYNDPLIYALSKFTNIFTTTGMNTYIVQGGGASNVWNLSYQLYGDYTYWWLIGMLNGIDNILAPIPNNTTIYYPTMGQINSYKSALAEMSSSAVNNNINPNYIGGTFSFPS